MKLYESSENTRILVVSKIDAQILEYMSINKLKQNFSTLLRCACNVEANFSADNARKSINIRILHAASSLFFGGGATVNNEAN